MMSGSERDAEIDELRQRVASLEVEVANLHKASTRLIGALQNVAELVHLRISGAVADLPGFENTAGPSDRGEDDRSLIELRREEQAEE